MKTGTNIEKILKSKECSGTNNVDHPIEGIKMYKKVLVPLDGSELAESVFPYVRELAARLDLDLVFLHVCTSEERAFTTMYRAYIERMANMVKDQSEGIRQKIGIQAEGKTVQAQGELTGGYPAEEIIRYANENEVDFIIMATHGYSGIKRLVMGSVADKVLRGSKIPIWLIRPRIPEELIYGKWSSRTVLVPLDGSELSESVIPHVEALAKQRGIELLDVVLLRVCTSPTTKYDDIELFGTSLNWDYVQQETAYCKKAVSEYLTEIEKRFKASNIHAQSVVLEGRAADEIVDYANSNSFNLIVMATLGHSGFSRWVLGSVTNRVLCGVSSPIFLIKPS